MPKKAGDPLLEGTLAPPCYRGSLGGLLGSGPLCDPVVLTPCYRPLLSSYWKETTSRASPWWRRPFRLRMAPAPPA